MSFDFFSLGTPLSLSDIANFTNSRLPRGGGEVSIDNIASIEDAGSGDICFLENSKYIKQLENCQASACFITSLFQDKLPENIMPIVTERPGLAYALTAARLFPEAMGAYGYWQGKASGGRHIHAIIHETAQLEENVTVEPGAIIGERVHIGRDSCIGANAVISYGVHIGRNCSIGANVSLSHSHTGDNVIIHPNSAIGQDGFGFVGSESGIVKIPQIGMVIIQDNVEIGAGVTIDRGSNRNTVIGESSKIDNQVHVAHNVIIGRHCFLAGKVGIAGSTKIEDLVSIGGTCAIEGHILIGKGAKIGGASVVTKNIPAGEVWMGHPARPMTTAKREIATLRQLSRKGKDK